MSSEGEARLCGSCHDGLIKYEVRVDREVVVGGVTSVVTVDLGMCEACLVSPPEKPILSIRSSKRLEPSGGAAEQGR